MPHHALFPFSLFALDAATQRRTDENGFLHVAASHISKECVNPYYGREIPGWEDAALDPERVYYGYRPAAELAQGAPTFNGLPLLLGHHPESADEPQKDARVGSLGTEAAFHAPYLNNSLVVTDAQAIRRIESGEAVQLSAAYRYDPVFTPGSFQGQAYDFIMTNIRGNHVALVQEGRAGADVVVADAKPNLQTRRPMPEETPMTKKDEITGGRAKRRSSRDDAANNTDATRSALLELLDALQNMLQALNAESAQNPDTKTPEDTNSRGAQPEYPTMAGAQRKNSPFQDPNAELGTDDTEEDPLESYSGAAQFEDETLPMPRKASALRRGASPFAREDDPLHREEGASPPQASTLPDDGPAGSFEAPAHESPLTNEEEDTYEAEDQEEPSEAPSSALHALNTELEDLKPESARRIRILLAHLGLPLNEADPAEDEDFFDEDSPMTGEDFPGEYEPLAMPPGDPFTRNGTTPGSGPRLFADSTRPLGRQGASLSAYEEPFDGRQAPLHEPGMYEPGLYEPAPHQNSPRARSPQAGGTRRALGFDAAPQQGRADHAARQSMRRLLHASRLTRPILGDVDPLAFDSAEALYAAALHASGFNPHAYPRAAWRGMAEAVAARRTEQHTPAAGAHPLEDQFPGLRAIEPM